MLFYLSYLSRVKMLVPSDAHQDFDTPIELKNGLGGSSARLRPQKGGEGEHDLEQLPVTERDQRVRYARQPTLISYVLDTTAHTGLLVVDVVASRHMVNAEYRRKQFTKFWQTSQICQAF